VSGFLIRVVEFYQLVSKTLVVLPCMRHTVAEHMRTSLGNNQREFG
jgi:hypothetical protein